MAMDPTLTLNANAVPFVPPSTSIPATSALTSNTNDVQRDSCHRGQESCCRSEIQHNNHRLRRGRGRQQYHSRCGPNSDEQPFDCTISHERRQHFDEKFKGNDRYDDCKGDPILRLSAGKAPPQKGGLNRHKQEHREKDRRRKHNSKNKGESKRHTLDQSDNRLPQSEGKCNDRAKPGTQPAANSSPTQRERRRHRLQHHHKQRRGRQELKKDAPPQSNASKSFSGDSAKYHQTARTEKIPDADHKVELELEEGSFPQLATSKSPVFVYNDRGGDTSWNQSLTTKLASLELESRGQLNSQTQQDTTQFESMESTSSVQLTKLSSRPLQARDMKTNEKELVDIAEEEDAHPVLSATDISSSQSKVDDGDCLATMIPNTKSKWSNAELSKMRQRWWDAAKARRMELSEANKKRRQSGNGEVALLQNNNGFNDRDLFSEEGDSCSGTDCSSSACSVFSSDEDSIYHSDSEQPPSLSMPFDELTSPMQIQTQSMPFDELTSPPQTQKSHRTPQSILNLEQKCLQSAHPLHCALYSYALSHNPGTSLNNLDGNIDSLECNEKADAEVVLERLLTMHDPSEVVGWRCERVGLSELRRLQSNEHRQDLRADMLTDATVDLITADTTSLSPLQLAIYFNLPKVVRLLCTAMAPQGTKAEEEDYHGRTPLMLACELCHAACIQAILCGSSPKLDRRERKGGYMAYHFCCMSDRNGDALGCGSSCVEAMDVLLRYTPVALQKKVLASTNCKGQNLFHIACSRGNLPLVERLLAQRDGPGIKISKALNAKDGSGYTPFLAAVMADATDIVTHLLTTRFAAGADYSAWFAGCPLVLAASKLSVKMVNLLLEVNYDGSALHNSGDKHEEVNRALLEAVYHAEGDANSVVACELIHELICHGGANPHVSAPLRLPGMPDKASDRAKLIAHGKLSQGDVPLSAAVRAADAEAVECMVDAYSSALQEARARRRNDPLLRSQPSSYFQLLEDKEDDAVHSSVDAAVVASLLLLWQNSSSSMNYGRCALVLYRRGRSSLSHTAGTRHFSQRAMLWLERSIYTDRLVPPPLLKNDSIEGYYFEAPVAQYRISDTLEKRGDNVPYDDAGANFMDWSYVLASLPWFRSGTYGVTCDLMRSIIVDSSDEAHVKFNEILSEDEFFLVADGEKLLAHKSIVSAKSFKLAAQIRFTQAHASEHPLSVHVDLPKSVAKMLLSHCYHGSIAFGLIKSPLKRCHQLLEMALVAEEYLCPSLLMECEARLLMQTSSHEGKAGNSCICPRCSGESIALSAKIDCPVRRQCLENAKKNQDDNYPESLCEPVGICAYKTSSFITSTNQSGLITPESALDVLAVAQQMEQSSCCQQGLYAMKYCQSGSIDDATSTMAMSQFGCWNIDLEKNVGAGHVSTPFAAAKMIAIWTILRDFPAVLRSDSYLRQIDIDVSVSEEDDSLALGKPAGSDEDAVLLLQTCLEELACCPFKKDGTGKNVSAIPGDAASLKEGS